RRSTRAATRTRSWELLSSRRARIMVAPLRASLRSSSARRSSAAGLVHFHPAVEGLEPRPDPLGLCAIPVHRNIPPHALPPAPPPRLLPRPPRRPPPPPCGGPPPPPTSPPPRPRGPLPPPLSKGGLASGGS